MIFELRPVMQSSFLAASRPVTTLSSLALERRLTRSGTSNENSSASSPNRIGNVAFWLTSDSSSAPASTAASASALSGAEAA